LYAIPGFFLPARELHGRSLPMQSHSDAHHPFF
jgi:hypothetical protein